MDILSKARSKMLLKHPFFATLALTTPFVERDDIPTAATDMVSMFYNPQFIETLPLDQVMTLIAHEIGGHIALLHGERLHQRDPLVWNMACDYAINDMLVDAGFEPIDGWLYDRRFKGMSADAIYPILIKERDARRKQQGQGQGQGQGQPSMDDSIGHDLLPPDIRTPADMDRIKQQVQQRVAQAAAMARMAGKMSAGIERLIGEVLTPPLPWLDILRDRMTRVTRDDETWSRPNRRFADAFMPARYSVRIGPMIIIGDTSGSITNDELARIGSEAAAIAEQLQPASLRVVWADTKVCGEQVFEQGDDIALKPQGFGGTDMRVPLAHVEQYDPEMVILITDGYTPWPQVEPDYPLIVLCTTNTNVPIGEVIRL